ncbi:MAG: peptide deformylase [Ruminococcus sp.]|nr:peptide deformylase [Candidatus Apopatosoma intestinale]
MAKLTILTEEDPQLRKISRPVAEITPRILTLLDDMLETMREADGVGIAAPQVGILRRVVVVEVEPGNVIELINPEIVDKSGSQVGIEGCLSLPGKHGICDRPSYVRVRALDRTGTVREYEGTELLARCFCHEIDHLDGILYSDVADRMLTPEEWEDYVGESEE